MKTVMVLIFWFLLAPFVQAAQMETVHDGDTFYVLDQDGRKKIRLWGVDAPEYGQAGCLEARTALELLLASKELRIERKGTSYDRIVGRVLIGEHDVAELLLAKGFVMLDERYTQRLAYRNAQASAKGQGKGVWAGPSVPPWVWRKQHTSKYRTCY